MYMRPEFSAVPPPPMNIAIESTAGSACTIWLSSSWRRFISANEMSWGISETAVRKPLSCCGKKPFGIRMKR